MAIAIIFVCSAVASQAHATPISQNAPLTKGPPPEEITSPYDPALQCLSSQLSVEERSTSFSVGAFPDRTGKANFVADSGAGNFSTSGSEDMLMSSLSRAGVRTVDTSPTFRSGIDWMFQKIVLSNHQHAVDVSLAFPDVIINGAITTFDFMPGGGASINIAGAQLAHQQSRILVGMDARAVLMPGSRIPGAGGTVLTTDRISKQIVGYEDSAGGTAFFGPKNSSTFVSIDFGHRPTEAIQFAERIMVDRLAAVLVSRVFNIKSCDAQLRYGDTLANLR